MSVALLYDGADLAPLVAALQAAQAAATGSDKTALTRILNAIGDWTLLPLAPAQYQAGDGDVRPIVLPNQVGAKADVLALLDRARSFAVAAAFLRAIVKDARTSGIDPWVG